jgi:hypothetical protein
MTLERLLMAKEKKLHEYIYQFFGKKQSGKIPNATAGKKPNLALIVLLCFCGCAHMPRDAAAHLSRTGALSGGGGEGEISTREKQLGVREIEKMRTV